MTYFNYLTFKIIFIFFIINISFCSDAVLIASSSIEYCERGSNSDPLPCEKKMVVTLTVDSAQAAGVEEFVFIRDATDKTKSGGETRVEFEPILMTTKKSQVQYRYPVFYERNFNAKPFEQQVYSDIFQGCSDSLDISATCGIAVDTKGVPIPYSQGFCCSCGVCQLAGLCPPDSRSVDTCSIFLKTASASCLRFGEIWYSGYNIGSGSAWYRVQVTLSSGTTGSNNYNETTLQLGPDILVDSASDFGAWGRLVGDFVPPEVPLDLTNKMLFVPASPRTHARVLAGPREWMLLDKTLVTLQGRECNKVGVSYEAFSGQGNRCEMSRGSCLGDQLEDYRTLDIAKEAIGGRGNYMARFFGDFNLISSNSSNIPYISYWMRGSMATMVTITISADKLQYIQSVSSGEIVSVSVSKKTINVSSRDGIITITARNTGTATSSYTLGIINCTEGVFPIFAQSLSMKPQEEVTRSFDLYIQNVTAQGMMQCSASLRNSQGVIVDTKIIQFNVSQLEWTNGAQGDSAPNGNGESVVSEGNDVCSQCNWFDLVCFVKHGCIWQPLIFILALAAIVLIIYFLRTYGCCAKSNKRKTHVGTNEPTVISQVYLPQTMPVNPGMSQIIPSNVSMTQIIPPNTVMSPMMPR